MRHLFLVAMMIAACEGEAPTPEDAGPPAWQVVVQKLDGALLGVWGSGKNVYAVGGPRGNGFEALALHYDGASWKRLHPGHQETYWWVHGTGPADVWFVGENGKITHYDGTRTTEHASGTTATLFGVFAIAPNDAWAVGGTPEGGTQKPNDVVLHWDGTRWTPSPVPDPKGRAFYKAWASKADDLYVVGEAGTIWHRTGGAWKLESDPPIARGTLLTVSGCSAGDVYAVGGRDVLRRDGSGWSRVQVELTNDVNGVSCGPGGDLAIVGFGGLKQRRPAGGAFIDEFASPPFADLHATYIDPEGAVWAVGGNFINPPQAQARRDGIIGRHGKGKVSGQIAP
jgi:hypothetical protein